MEMEAFQKMMYLVQNGKGLFPSLVDKKGIRLDQSVKRGFDKNQPGFSTSGKPRSKLDVLARVKIK